MAEVRREIVLDAAREDVWAALTEAERLAEWFANDVELDVEPGGEGVFRWRDGAVRRAVVERVEPGTSLTFSWWADDERVTTVVGFTLEEVAEGTKLTVVESFAAPNGLRASAATPVPEWAWAIELGALASVLVRRVRVA